MPTQLQQDMVALQDQVIKENYYVDLYQRALKAYNMTQEDIKNFAYNDAKIVDMTNSFWFELPESPAVRRDPFWALCNIAEHCFDDEVDE